MIRRYNSRIRFRPESALTHLELAELLLDDYPAEVLEASYHLDFAIEEFRAIYPSSKLVRLPCRGSRLVLPGAVCTTRNRTARFRVRGFERISSKAYVKTKVSLDCKIDSHPWQRCGSKKHPGHTITVSSKSVAAHLRHGDHLGPCTGTEKPRPKQNKGHDDEGNGHDNGKGHDAGSSTTTTTSSDDHGNGKGKGRHK